MELLRNLIDVSNNLNYTPQYKLDKSFRLLKTRSSPPEHAWKSIQTQQNFVTNKKLRMHKVGGKLQVLPTKYLGFAFGQGTIRQASWQDLLDRIKARLTNWVLKPLNLLGRIEMVKSVLQAM